MTRKRIRNVPIYVWVRQDELEAIQERMASLGIQNTYGGIYPGEIESLRLDYDALWERTGEVLRQLAELVVI